MSNYHYTKAIHLANIVNEGQIRVTRMTNYKKERLAVWLTKSEEWEVCCSAGKIDENGTNTRLSLDEMKETFGVCRIKISDKLQTTSYAKFKHVGKVPSNYFDLFTEYNYSVGGKPHLWNCSFKPIPKEYFESIEMMVGDEWVKWDGTVSIEEFVDICHSCNSRDEIPKLKEIAPEILGQINFLNHKQGRIIEAWEANKGKRGYLEIYVKEDYDTHSIKFIEKGFKESDFYAASESDSGDYILMHLLWHDTHTHYKAAFAYNPQERKLQMLDFNQAA
jgi:hypothetical protein